MSKIISINKFDDVGEDEIVDEILKRALVEDAMRYEEILNDLYDMSVAPDLFDRIMARIEGQA